MQKIEIICLGKLKETYWKDALAEYSKRLSPYCSLSITELPEAPLSDNPTPGQIANALEAEAQQIQKQIKERTYVIPLCIEGTQMPSEAFAEKLSQISLSGRSSITFVIGSSHGLSPQIKKRGDLQLSFSKMTFPHQLMRVILTEQLYRAYTILSNKKYHK